MAGVTGQHSPDIKCYSNKPLFFVVVRLVNVGKRRRRSSARKLLLDAKVVSAML